MWSFLHGGGQRVKVHGEGGRPRSSSQCLQCCPTPCLPDKTTNKKGQKLNSEPKKTHRNGNGWSPGDKSLLCGHFPKRHLSRPVQGAVGERRRGRAGEGQLGGRWSSSRRNATVKKKGGRRPHPLPDVFSSEPVRKWSNS